MSARKVSILDTTTRDGRQGLVNPDQARQNGDPIRAAVKYALASSDFGCGYMDAGFSFHNNGAQVRAIAEAHSNNPSMSILSFTRAIKKDIDHAVSCVESAKRSGVAILVSPSNSHAVKFAGRYPDLTPAQIQDQKMGPKFVDACKHAAGARESGLITNVFAYIEDSTRMTDTDQIKRCADMCRHLIDAGVDIISLPDTMGVADPEEYVDLFRAVHEFLGPDYAQKILWSAHCHKDFGMGMANTMAAAKAGVVDILEGTFGGNGPGEGLGNCDLNVIIHQLLRKRLKDLPPHLQNLNFKSDQLYNINLLAAVLLGRPIPEDSPIVGSGKPQRETGAGIHQDALKKALDALETAKNKFKEAVAADNEEAIKIAQQKLDEAQEGVGVYTHAEEFAKYGVPQSNLFAVTDQTGHTGLQAAFQERNIERTDMNQEKAHKNAVRIARLLGHKLTNDQLDVIAWEARFPEDQRVIQIDWDKVDMKTEDHHDQKTAVIPLSHSSGIQIIRGVGLGSVGAFVAALENFMQEYFDVSVDVDSYRDVADIENEIIEGENRDAEVLVNMKLRINGDVVTTFGFDRDQDDAAFKACLLAVNKWIKQNQKELVE